MRRDELNPLKLSIILFLIAGLSGFILSMVYSITQPRILENEKIKDQDSLKEIMPGLTSFKQEKDRFLIYGEGEQLIGYVIKTQVKGYGGILKCSVGIDLNNKITGLVVSSHSETPGLGSKIEEVKKGANEPYYLSQFRNLTEQQLDFENVKAISGATISSKAVMECVKQAFQKLHQKI